MLPTSKAGRAVRGFRVPDLGAFHEKALGAGVRCVQEPRQVFGARVAQYADPNGLVFPVGEAPEARLDLPLVPESPCTAYTQRIGITQQDLYHAGQIALLKRALASAAP
jgi:Glyoxalase/Bleomycin resistance protein/Dioxygenase superfamily